MDDQFRLDECLFRAVFSKDLLKSTGKPSSAAFKDPHNGGLSVERDGGRSLEAAADGLQAHLRGAAVYVTVSTCYECKALVRYSPSPQNKYHSEIHSSDNVKLLSNSQAKHLADNAVVFRL